MSNDQKARVRVSCLIFSMVNAVLFGTGLITILSVPSLSEQAFVCIPVVVICSFVLAPPIAWLLAPSMMQRYLQAKNPPFAAKLSRELEAGTTT